MRHVDTIDTSLGGSAVNDRQYSGKAQGIIDAFAPNIISELIIDYLASKGKDPQDFDIADLAQKIEPALKKLRERWLKTVDNPRFQTIQVPVLVRSKVRHALVFAAE